jgi:hypothetical protein
MSACIRRDFERIRSGIKPRVSARGKCTWLTLVDSELFAAFCRWHPCTPGSSAAEASSPDTTRQGELAWTGPTPDELDEAAAHLGVSLGMDNWHAVRQEALLKA